MSDIKGGTYYPTQIYENMDNEKLHALYCLSVIISRSWLSNNITINPLWEVWAPITEEFKSFIGDDSFLQNISRAEIAFAAFRLFYYNDILFDVDACDLKSIEVEVNRMILERDLCLPYMYGRTLYNKFNSVDEWYTLDSLDPENSENLLKDTPQGVYQVGNYLTGPFGIIKSAESRYTPPTTEVPLWHCPNIECPSFHTVKLKSSARILKTIRAIVSIFEGRDIYRGDWHNILKRIVDDRDSGFYKFYDIINFVGDAIIGRERSEVVKDVLKSDSVRELKRLVAGSGLDIILRGSPDQIVENLNEAELMQILFALPNRDVVRHIDGCVNRLAIKIQPYENRVPKVYPPKYSSFSSKTEISSFGIRSSIDDPIVNLVACIWDAYEGKYDALGWSIGIRDRSIKRDDLVDYVRVNSIENVVNSLIMSDKSVFNRVCSYITYSPKNNFDRVDATNAVAYKLGFKTVKFDERIATFTRRIDQFFDTVTRIGDIDGELDRERIREAGVNLFVSVEEFLEELLVFNVWMMSSDHVLKTRFMYNHIKAIPEVAKVLGEELESSGARFIWNADGSNTIGVSLAYLNKFINWMKDNMTTDKKLFEKHSESLPHYVNDKPEYLYLRHTMLWADCESSNLLEYLSGLEAISKNIARSNLPSVRNGLDHKRRDEEFPSIESLINFCRPIRLAFEASNRDRYIPKIWALDEMNVSRNQIITYKFVDHKGEGLYRYGPKFVASTPDYSWGSPVIMAPFNLLGHSQAYINFVPEEDTPFSKYWADFPIKRRLGEE